jgi:hypothetical protein
LRPVDLRAAVFLRPVLFLLPVDFLRAVDFFRPVDLRAVDFLAVDFRAVDFRAAGLRVVFRRVDFFRPVVFFAATPLHLLSIVRRVLADSSSRFNNTSKLDVCDFNYHNCPEYTLHKRAFNLLLRTKLHKDASINRCATDLGVGGDRVQYSE